MSRAKNKNAEEVAAGASPRAVLRTRTAFQIYKSDGSPGSASVFSTLSNDEMLPYKIQSDELTMMAALDVVEADPADRRMYGPATLHLVVNYLSNLLSFIPRGGRSHELPTVAINYNALQRVVTLYGATEAVKDALAQLARTNPSASEVPIRDMSFLLDNFGATEKALRHEMRDAGEKVGSFTKSTLSASTLAATGDTAINDVAPSASSPKASRKRRASSRGEVSPARKTEGPNTAPPSKVMKMERGRRATRNVKNTATQFTLQRMVYGRLRALTSQEKKVVTLLNQMIQLLGHVCAVRYNNLLPIFDLLENRVKNAQEIIDAERRTSSQLKSDRADAIPEQFLEVTLDGILEAIQNASHLFQTDEECRYELDEDLLHPIAHACMTEVNRIEGFTTAPFEGLSEGALRAKAKAREAARAKREEQRTKALERARAKEELAAKREEERKQIRAHLGELDPTSLLEDVSIKNPIKTAYVRYGKLPLETPAEYERALFIWCMLTSLPRPLHLSQMPFSLFLQGLLSDEGCDNGLMEEVVLALLNVAMENLRSSNGPKVLTRGRDWFGSMVELVAVCSGNKKTRPPQRPKAVSYEEEEEEEEEEDESDETEEEEEESQDTEWEEKGDDGEDETEAANSSGGEDRKLQEQEEKEKDEQTEGASECGTDGLDAGIKVTLEKVAELRQMAAWGNVDMEDRLNLLHYMVLEALSSPAAKEEAEKIRKMHEDMQTTMEKRTKEIREGAHKEIASLLRQFSSSRSANGDSETYESKRKKLFEEMEKKLQTVVNEHLGMQDGKDIGALIRPLGMDRYRRMYWRFPFDRHIVVQSTSATDPNFPILPEPRELVTQSVKDLKPMLLDDSDETGDHSTNENGHGHTSDNEGVPQRVWGVVPPEYLGHFIEGLDRRGVREAALRRSLESIQPYLLNLSEPPVGRVTRMRSHTLGYFNKLRIQL